jgi:hypothetical protein
VITELWKGISKGRENLSVILLKNVAESLEVETENLLKG